MDEQIKASRPPETQAVAAPQNDGPPARPGLVRAKRPLTPDEINFIRQTEWTENDQNVRVQVTQDARKGAIDLGLISQDTIGNMSPADIGWKIVKQGPPGLRKDVKISNDTGAVASYHMQAHRLVIATCATGACHNTSKGGKFFLFTDPPQSDETIVSDYLVLEQFAMTIDNVEHQMIDRLHPENSLLTQFALPPAAGEFSAPQGGRLYPAGQSAVRAQADQGLARLSAGGCADLRHRPGKAGAET